MKTTILSPFQEPEIYNSPPPNMWRRGDREAFVKTVLRGAAAVGGAGLIGYGLYRGPSSSEILEEAVPLAPEEEPQEPQNTK